MWTSARRMLQVTGVAAVALVTLIGEWVLKRLRRRSQPVGPYRLRRTLEALGPTFMKLGQILSTRPDLVSPAYEAELSRLQDAAPRVPWPAIRDAVTDALGAAPDASFAEFVRAPLAAASIGQVHAARLADGTSVVVKVRRPGVTARIGVDLALMRHVAKLLAALPPARRFDPRGLAREFAETITEELDYMHEARNAERLASELAEVDGIEIPAIIWDRTREGVLTETRIEGLKIDDTAGIVAAGLDRARIAHDFADAYLTMVFVHRFFHADPHPGNVFVERDATIGFVDFGMVGTVDAATGSGLIAVLGALVAADAPKLADALVDLGVATTQADRVGLEADLERILDRYGDVALQDLRLAEVVADLMTVVRRRDLRLPSRVALLLKTVVMCEGVAAKLDPGFRLIPLLVPYAARFRAGGST